ncbi:MAG: hypothetical protein NT177_01065, partial [Chloroflexi bacterium]|nr:hypothetical protein [Chloroflexota bacterium]
DIKSASEMEAAKAAHREEAAEHDLIEQDQEKLVVEGLEPDEEAAAEALTGEEEESEGAADAAEAAGAGIEILMPVDAASPAPPSKIRFAEEIMAGRTGKSRKKEAPKKEGDGKDTGGKDTGTKAKKTKAKKKTYYEDEEFDSGN